MSPDTATALIYAHPDATPEQWATLAAAVQQQPDADYLADVLNLQRAMHDEAAGVDRARAVQHPRKVVLAGRRTL